MGDVGVGPPTAAGVGAVLSWGCIGEGWAGEAPNGSITGDPMGGAGGATGEAPNRSFAIGAAAETGCAG